MRRKVILEFSYDTDFNNLNIEINRENIEHFDKEELVAFLNGITQRLENNSGGVNWTDKTKEDSEVTQMSDNNGK